MVWRAAYPHLPARVQVLPYRLRERSRPHTQFRKLVPTPRALDSLSHTSALVPPPTSSPSRLGHTSVAGATATLPSPPSATPPPLPARAQLEGLRHEYQTWNNCGPATTTMALSYYGRLERQADAARVLKPDPDDKNVSPDEMAHYARSLGLKAIVRTAGDIDKIKRLIAGGVPVIVETWFIPKPGDEMGHYRLVTGYDEPAAFFVAHDSYKGPATRIPYAAFDQGWRVFGRVYVAIYGPQQADSVSLAIGEAHLDDRAMYAAAERQARTEVETRGDAYAWFNLGASLVAQGRSAEAAQAFDRARQIGLPWRMLWYQFGPFEAYYAEARYQDVMDLADANLATAGNLEESHYWRGRAFRALGAEQEARQAFERALALNPHFAPAASALAAMPH
jgi:tetratricopeptide (TPR) repeat protein